MGAGMAAYAFRLARQDDGDGVSVLGFALLALTWMIQMLAKCSQKSEVVALGVKLGYSAGIGVTVAAGLEAFASPPKGYVVASVFSIAILFFVTGALALALVWFSSNRVAGCCLLLGSVVLAWVSLELVWVPTSTYLTWLWVEGPPPLPIAVGVVLCIAWGLGSKGARSLPRSDEVEVD